ncbi:MAG: extracellular solute-binding protein [Firmicutes bacterium]|nr:extracellular solute-binding protein [Bacillota bacterium]
MDVRKKVCVMGIILLLASLALLVVGCGNKADVTGDSEYSGGVYPENGLPKDQKVKLRFIYPVAGHGKEHFQYAVETFQKRFPNVEIDVRYIEAGLVAYRDIIRSLIQSGDEDEIYDWLYAADQQLIAAGKYEPQDELWERPLYDRPDVKVKDVIDVDPRELYKHGHIYCLPTGLSIFGVFYNKQIFDDLGLEEPKNWPEFIKVCEKIKAHGIYPMVMDGKHAANYFTFGWGNMPFAVGGEEYADAAYYQKPDLYISKPFIVFLERLAEFAKKGYLHPGTASFDHTQSQMEFIQGKAAMITNGTWIANEMKDVTPPDFKWGFMPLPGNAPGEKRLLNLDSSGSGYIWKNKPELIKKWVKEFNLWQLNLDIQLRFAKAGGVPARKDFLEKYEQEGELSPSVKVALEILKSPDIAVFSDTTERVISNSEMAKVHKKKGDCYIALITGRMTPEEAAKVINDQYMKGLELDIKQNAQKDG